MYVRTVKVRSSSGAVNEHVRVVEAYRENGKVKQRVVADLGRKDQVFQALHFRLYQALIGSIALALGKKVALGDGWRLESSSNPSGEPRMAQYKGSSKRPQARHRKHKKSQHDKRKRLQRRNPKRKRTTWAPYFCTDTSAEVRDILEAVAARWAIEEHFHDVKEVWGAGQQQVRNVWSNIACWHLSQWLYALVELCCRDVRKSELTDHCHPSQPLRIIDPCPLRLEDDGLKCSSTGNRLDMAKNATLL
jgi:hypothetical protein